MKHARKQRKAATRQLVLAYDLGGTKVAVGVVDSSGKILAESRVPAVFSEGKKAVLDQLIALGREMIHKFPKVRRIGIASAGPLDPKKGILLDPTNFVSAKEPQGWGKVPLAAILSKALGKPATLENDAAAAMLAEHWKGAAKGFDNAMILTLGTGLGTGLITNGTLLRSGRHLHPEAGHIILKAGDTSAPCGCGNLGCAEAYLSGRSFARRSRLRFADPKLDGLAIEKMARAGDPRAIAAFDEYSQMMAIALHNYVVMFCPEIFVFTGSFANSADLFIEKTKFYLEQLLKRRRTGIDLMPQLAVSKLDNEAGLLGGAYVALNAS
jgi:glucokinase